MSNGQDRILDTVAATAAPPGEPRVEPAPAGSPALRDRLRGLRGSTRTLGILLALALMWLVFSLASPYFFTTTNIFNLFLQSANVGIVAAGLTLVMIAGEIDLSVGSLEGLSGAMAAILIIEHGLPFWLGIIGGLAATVVAGLISGLVTWRLKVVSFVSTLAMLGIAQGAAYLLTNGNTISGFGNAYDAIGTWKIGGFPGAAVIAIAIFIVLHLLLTRTRLGVQIYAVGGNREAAENAGINVGRVKLITLMISGLTAGIGGLILSSRLDTGSGLFGANDLLNAVAAVVIGGTSLFGGVGSIAGTAVGILIVESLDNGLIILNVSSFWQEVAVGIAIIAAMAFDQVVKSTRLAVR